MSASTIAGVRGRRIWDSRGRPTVEAEVTLANGAAGRGVAPAGASRGRREAVDLRDGGTALGGYGVDKALERINGELAALLAGMDAQDQEAVDRAMIEADGTSDMSRLGGNATIAVSTAALTASAAGDPLWKRLARNRPVRLPMPEIQIFGGGAHAGRRLDIQDFMAIPVGAGSFQEALVMIAEVYGAAGRLMESAGKRFGVADEGGWWPAFESNEEALDALVRAIEAAGFAPGADVAVSLDVAASQFGSKNAYRFKGREADSDGMIELLGGWIDRYPVVSVEDPLAEDDEAGLRRFTELYGSRIQIVGDDFLVTDAARIRAAATAGACNAALIKPNQTGTITGAKAALDAATDAGWGAIVSARSGETEDVAVAHLAVGWDVGRLKVGSFARSERMAKWNEVIRIGDAIGDRAELAVW